MALLRERVRDTPASLQHHQSTRNGAGRRHLLWVTQSGLQVPWERTLEEETGTAAARWCLAQPCVSFPAPSAPVAAPKRQKGKPGIHVMCLCVCRVQGVKERPTPLSGHSLPVGGLRSSISWLLTRSYLPCYLHQHDVPTCNLGKINSLDYKLKNHVTSPHPPGSQLLL